MCVRVCVETGRIGREDVSVTKLTRRRNPTLDVTFWQLGELICRPVSPSTRTSRLTNPLRENVVNTIELHYRTRVQLQLK